MKEDCSNAAEYYVDYSAIRVNCPCKISGNNQIFNECQKGLIPFVLISMAVDLNYVYFKGTSQISNVYQGSVTQLTGIKKRGSLVLCTICAPNNQGLFSYY